MQSSGGPQYTAHIMFICPARFTRNIIFITSAITSGRRGNRLPLLVSLFHSPPKRRRNMMLMVVRSEFLQYLLFYLNRAQLSLMASHKTECSKAWSDFQRLIDVKNVMRKYVTRANNEFSRVPKLTPALRNLDMILLELTKWFPSSHTLRLPLRLCQLWSNSWTTNKSNSQSSGRTDSFKGKT